MPYLPRPKRVIGQDVCSVECLHLGPENPHNVRDAAGRPLCRAVGLRRENRGNLRRDDARQRFRKPLYQELCCWLAV